MKVGLRDCWTAVRKVGLKAELLAFPLVAMTVAQKAYLWVA